MLRSLFRTRAAKVTLAATSGVFLYDLYSTNQSRLEMVAGASTTNSKSHHAGTGFSEDLDDRSLQQCREAYVFSLILQRILGRQLLQLAGRTI